jgi:hypothetical protein
VHLKYMTANLEHIKSEVHFDEHSHGITGPKLVGEWPKSHSAVSSVGFPEQPFTHMHCR